MSRVIHFELAADDPQRAIAFYEKVFGSLLSRKLVSERET